MIQKSPSLSQKSQKPQSASQLPSRVIEIKRKPISKTLYKQVSRRQVELKKRPQLKKDDKTVERESLDQKYDQMKNQTKEIESHLARNTSDNRKHLERELMLNIIKAQQELIDVLRAK